MKARIYNGKYNGTFSDLLSVTPSVIIFASSKIIDVSVGNKEYSSFKEWMARNYQ